MKVISCLKVAFFSILLISSIFAQSSVEVIGKVFPNADAVELFGVVETSVKVPVSKIKEQLSKAESSIMFMIKNGDIIITDTKRNLLSTEKSVPLKSTDVLHKFSVSVVKELLSKGNSDYVIFEQRGVVLTVTSGTYTMEFSTLCPPMCE